MMPEFWKKANTYDRSNLVGHGVASVSFVLMIFVIGRAVNGSWSAPLAFMQILITTVATVAIFFIARNAMKDWYDKEKKNGNTDENAEPPRKAGTT